jgi:hypothetical protein
MKTRDYWVKLAFLLTGAVVGFDAAVNVANSLSAHMIGAFDAANTVLNRDTSRINVNVTATGIGSFGIDFEIVQTIASQLTALFSGETVTAAK